MNGTGSDCVQTTKPLGIEIVLLWSFAGFIVFCLNFIIVISLLCNRILRRRSTIPVLSLSIADMLIGVFGFPVHILSGYFWDLLNTPDQTALLCKLTSSSTVFLITATMLNVFFLTLDRAFLVIYPIRYRVFMTGRKTVVLVSILWTISAIIGCLTYFETYEKRKYSLMFFVCQNQGINKRMIVILTSIISSVLICLVFVYTIIVHSVAISRKKVIHKASMVTPSSADSTPKSSVIHGVAGNERKLTISSILVVTLFLLMWTPHLALSLHELFRDCPGVVPFWARVLTLTLALSNSGSNGIIYAIRTRSIRQGFLAVLTCKCNKSELALGHSTPSSRFGTSPMLALSPHSKKGNGPVGRSSQGPLQSPTLFRAAVTNHWQSNLKTRQLDQLSKTSLNSPHPSARAKTNSISPLAC